ncbi:DNA-processing protein DprA [Volucribacter amazonae]|uniref:Smf/DprA SLOG domain-containing protein n=1 Tax=Volucribacter amazonae TaxID=256731 RepID=A0A9X4SMD0_9PAST|nr:DNA-processing protein DprA [Volucribacter amazonae]MDG6895978.1 hypothetical protein [Volucribacter amazonae]
MKYSKHMLNILTAKKFKGIGDAWIFKNLKKDLPLEEILSLLKKHLIKENSTDDEKEKFTEKYFKEKQKEVINNLDKLSGFYDGIVVFGDKNFPKLRTNQKIKDIDHPMVLFYKGDISLLDLSNHNVAVIGLLEPDEFIEKQERDIVDRLAKNNITIVSGLALGCDRIAHHQALCSGSKTIAILPSPLNNIIPKQCNPIAEYIGNKGGLLITEYYDEPESKYELNGRFIRRDRLQALFSDSVLLIASYSKSMSDKDKSCDSGARHAMEKAKAYGITRAVMYSTSNIKDDKYALNRELMKSDKDIIVVNPHAINDTIDRLLIKEEKQKSLF